MAVAVEVDVGHRPDRRIAVSVVDAPAGGVTILVDIEGIFAPPVLREVLRALHERGFEPQRDDHTDRGHMRRGREVHIQRMQLPAVVGDVGAAPVIEINPHIGVELAAGRGRGIVTCLTLVDVFGIAVSPIEPQLRADGVDLRELHDELQPHAIHGRTVVLVGILDERPLGGSGLHGDPAGRRVVLVADEDFACLAVDAECRVRRHRVGRPVGQRGRHAHHVIGERLEGGAQLVGIFRAIEIADQRDRGAPDTQVDADL